MHIYTLGLVFFSIIWLLPLSNLKPWYFTKTLRFRLPIHSECGGGIEEDGRKQVFTRSLPRRSKILLEESLANTNVLIFGQHYKGTIFDRGDKSLSEFVRSGKGVVRWCIARQDSEYEWHGIINDGGYFSGASASNLKDRK